MRIWPVFLDFEPPYLGGPGRGHSLLRAPLGADLLVSRLCRQTALVTPNAPLILAPHGSGADYRTRMHADCQSVTVVAESEQLADALSTAEMSDVLLLVDPRCFPADESQLASFVRQLPPGRQVVHHLVALATGIAGTMEHVHIDRRGLVRAVHRHYEPSNWPFVAGVAASLVPVSSHILSSDGIPSSLVELRQRLAERGVSSRDVSLSGGAMDLTKEHGLLAAMEHSVVEAVDRAIAAGGTSPVLVGDGHAIDPAARLLGPVVIHANVRIDRDATIVGPALMGEGAHVAAGAVVAHAVLGAQARVGSDRVLRDCVWVEDIDDRVRVRSELSYAERLARVSVEPHTTSRIRPLADAPDRWHLVFKRAFDTAVAAISLVLLSPLLAIVAVLVWLESGGPVFYRAQREGLAGRLFDCLKFRTMRVGADLVQHQLKGLAALDGPHFKLEHDPRLTRLGRILRATNVDELPQLFNVLRGDMSLVGPRPSPFRENQICVPWREGRLSVRPGMTGLWQMCRRDRSAGDFHQWIEYDLLYVQNLSPVLDLKILFATVLTLGGRVPVPITWLISSQGQLAQRIGGVAVPDPQYVGEAFAQAVSAGKATRGRPRRRESAASYLP
jgi:lipopolysaccharide/colanic/teichoic acid biosynthesis glycosyltransferase